ncbi:MAG: sel1 repeat family protein [Rhodocyclales bacterium]|nr:sel1 repeat family protein [Rhodocyclales bacterium]
MKIQLSSRWAAPLVLICSLLPGATALATPLDDALKALEAGSNPKAAETLLKLASEGNALAQFRLGGLYYHGQGVTEDENMAIYWWKKAAASGNAEAMFQIAHAYLFGNTAAKSVADPDREAALWYFQSASAGHAEAAYTLGLLFLAGKGVVEDRTEAIRWFRNAAAKGHAEARKAAETAEKEARNKSRR